jgi:sortase (surface protein transpeptidase)
VSPRHNGKDRTPAGRAVPALVALALLAFIGWLLPAVDRRQQPRPDAATAGGPTTISIPSIGVKARVVPVGLQADGAMQLPDPDQVGWYKLGSRPGGPGPAVLIGHVDDRTGPAVFYRLRQLHPGDAILVGERGGAIRRFLVGRLERHPKAELPVDRIWTTATRPLLRLITCGGSFDHSTGHYRDNLIVYASPTGN